MAEPFDTFQLAYGKADHGRDIAEEALVAAERCDEEAARRLAIRAESLITDAALLISWLHGAEPDTSILRDSVERVIASGRRRLEMVTQALANCADYRPIYEDNLEKGEFGVVEDHDHNSDLPINKVRFDFTLQDTEKCTDLCFVSVYHIERNESGETLQHPSEGDKRSDGLDIWASIGSPPPQDEDAIDGYVVDAPPNQKSPCWPENNRNGQTVSAFDAPSFVKPGHTAYFETCAICLDATATIFGCYRWVHTDDGTGSEAKLLPGGPFPPSQPFQRALWAWLKRRGT